MAKPSAPAEWSTSGGTRLEPTTLYKAQGFQGGDKPPARWLNWLFGVLADWTAYLNNLHNEAEFTNKAYTWTGTHTFNGLGATSIATDIELTDNTTEILYPVTPSRVHYADLWKARAYSPAASPAFDADGLPIFALAGSSNPMVVPFKLPVGAVLTQVRVSAFTGGSVTVTMTVMRRNGSMVAFPTASASIGSTSATFGGRQTMSVTPPPFVVLPNSEVWVELYVSSASGNDKILSVEVTWSDPGPRAQLA